MASYHVEYRAAFGPPRFVVVQVSGALRAAEEAARRLGVQNGRFRVYRRFDSRSVVYDGEVEVVAGRAVPRRGLGG